MQCESRRALILKQSFFSYKGGLHNKTEYQTLTILIELLLWPFITMESLAPHCMNKNNKSIFAKGLN